MKAKRLNGNGKIEFDGFDLPSPPSGSSAATRYSFELSKPQFFMNEIANCSALIGAETRVT